MSKEKIEALREKINNMITSENASLSELLKLSQELDILILEYIKGQQQE